MDESSNRRGSSKVQITEPTTSRGESSRVQITEPTNSARLQIAEPATGRRESPRLQVVESSSRRESRVQIAMDNLVRKRKSTLVNEAKMKGGRRE
jgi:hypothetical protein